MELNINVNIGCTPEMSELVRKCTLAVLCARGLMYAPEDKEEAEGTTAQTQEEKPAESPAEAPVASEKPKASRSGKKAEPAPAPEPEPEKPAEMPAAEEPMPMDPAPEKPAEISDDDLTRLAKAHLTSAKGYLKAAGLKYLSDMDQAQRRDFVKAMEDPNYVPYR